MYLKNKQKHIEIVKETIVELNEERTRVWFFLVCRKIDHETSYHSYLIMTFSPTLLYLQNTYVHILYLMCKIFCLIHSHLNYFIGYTSL